MRIDVIFDIEVCYRSESIKDGTGTKRKKGHQPVRRQMENELVPLSSDCSNCMSLEDNAKDIALLLSNYLIEHSPADKIVDWWLWWIR